MSTSGCILFVDDDKSSRCMMQTLLSRLGHQVDVAGSGAEALELIEERDFALVILDYMMPKMDGLTLFEQIRVVSPGTKGVFLTGYLTPECSAAALDAGVARVLAKPVDIKVLGPLIDELVGERVACRQ